MQKLIDKYKAELEVLKEKQTEIRERMSVPVLDRNKFDELRLRRAEIRCQMSVLFDVIIDLEREEIEKWIKN